MFRQSARAVDRQRFWLARVSVRSVRQRSRNTHRPGFAGQVFRLAKGQDSNPPAGLRLGGSDNHCCRLEGAGAPLSSD